MLKKQVYFMYRETNARVPRTIGLTILFSISSTAPSAPTGWIGGSGGSSQKPSVVQTDSI